MEGAVEVMNKPADLVALASGIAKAAHTGQFRNDGVTPYIRHPEAVAGRLRGEPYAEAAGWLHDVLEDTRETAASLRAKGVPEDVVACIIKLTKQADASYEDYLEQIRSDPLALKVKIADMLSNLGDNPTRKQIIKYAKGLLILLS
jgi:(p)ppGpp synthase/HD superfamily hydrolase